MTYYPTYALITHLVTLVVVLTASMHHKVRPIIYIILSIGITFIVSRLLLTDFGIYENSYLNIDTSIPIFESILLRGEHQTVYEPLYSIVTSIFRNYTENFNYARIFFVITALIIKIAFLLRWGNFYSVAFIFYISVLFYPDSYLLRASMSSSIVLLAIWSMMSKKSFTQFLLLILCAAGFHLSAFIALPFWFVKNMNITFKQSLILFTLILSLGFIGIGLPIINFIITIGAGAEEALIIKKLVLYSNSELYLASSGSGAASLVYLGITFLFIMLRERLFKIMPHYNFVLLMLLFGLFMLLGFSDFNIVAERVFRMVSFFLVIALGHVLSVFNEKDKFFISIFLIVVFNIIPYITDAGPFDTL